MPSRFQLPANLLEALPDPDRGTNLYVVGGAIRDHLLNLKYEDIDFAVDGDAIALAREVAGDLDWHFYTLDDERGAARILPKAESGPIRRVDFSRLRGKHIQEDLKHRDFTINALAVNVYEPAKLIDPTGGVSDMRAGILRACSATALRDDPVRVIRAVRFATNLEMTIHPETTAQLRDTVDQIEKASIERLRDEFFQILRGEKLAIAARLLDHLKIMAAIFQILTNENVQIQRKETQPDSGSIAAAAVGVLAQLAGILQPEHDAEAAADAIWGSVALRLGRFREQLSSHLDERLSADRTRMSLIAFATLALPYSGAAGSLPGSTTVSRGEEYHAQVPEVVSAHAAALRLSRAECEYIQKVAGGYQDLEGSNPDDFLTDLDVHRYFRRFDESGIGAVLLYVSGVVARSSGPPPADLWEHRLRVARSTLEAFFERHDEVVEPEVFINGSDLIQVLELAQGPEIGELLDAIREASVTKKISNREQALDFARQLMMNGPAT